MVSTIKIQINRLLIISLKDNLKYINKVKYTERCSYKGFKYIDY